MSAMHGLQYRVCDLSVLCASPCVRACALWSGVQVIGLNPCRALALEQKVCRHQCG